MKRAWIMAVVGAVVGVSQVAEGGLYWIESVHAGHPTESLWRAELDGSGARELITDLRISDSSKCWGMAVDGDQLYWSDIGPWVYTDGVPYPPHVTIMQVGLDGTGMRPATDVPPKVACELVQAGAFDEQGYRYFYLDNRPVGGGEPTSGHIVRSPGNSYKELIATPVFFPHPDIALDLTARKIYWAGGWDTEGAGVIQRANLDGSDVQTLVDGVTLDIADNGIGLCLDIPAGKMYWNNSRAGMIQRANLDGTDVEPVITGIYPRAGLALDLGDRPLPEWAMHIDAVTLLPEPGTGLIIMLVAGGASLRRRRTEPKTGTP